MKLFRKRCIFRVFWKPLLSGSPCCRSRLLPKNAYVVTSVDDIWPKGAASAAAGRSGAREDRAPEVQKSSCGVVLMVWAPLRRQLPRLRRRGDGSIRGVCVRGLTTSVFSQLKSRDALQFYEVNYCESDFESAVRFKMANLGHVPAPSLLPDAGELHVTSGNGTRAVSRGQLPGLLSSA